MARNGSDVYSVPANTRGASGTTIESAKYNAFIDDLEEDLNLARPIAVGGTGATSASAARTALGVTTGFSFATAITVASAATCDILGAASIFCTVTGTTTITSFGTGTNKLRVVVFSGALTLTHNGTTLICPGAANITTAAGDVAVVMSDASSNARIVAYQRAAYQPQGLATTSLAGIVELATAAEILTRTADKIVAADTLWGPMAPVTLTSSSTPTPNLNNGRKFSLTFDESFTLQLPTNCAVGDEFVIHFTEGSGSGVTAAFASGYKGNGGTLPTINVGASERTRVHFEVTAISGSTATEVVVSGAGGLWA